MNANITTISLKSLERRSDKEILEVLSKQPATILLQLTSEDEINNLSIVGMLLTPTQRIEILKTILKTWNGKSSSEILSRVKETLTMWFFAPEKNLTENPEELSTFLEALKKDSIAISIVALLFLNESNSDDNSSSLYFRHRHHDVFLEEFNDEDRYENLLVFYADQSILDMNQKEVEGPEMVLETIRSSDSELFKEILRRSLILRYQDIADLIPTKKRKLNKAASAFEE